MKEKPFVLFVDDEPNVLRSYKRALRHEEYEVLVAHSGLEALEVVKAHHVDIVVSDFRMAGMNGIELLQAVRSFDSKIVCAILSGYADEATVKQALKSNQISRFLLKPIDNTELKSEIQKLLKLRVL